MKISKKVREEAAMILQVAASNGESMKASALAIGASGLALALASLAYYDRLVPFLGPFETHAAAEQLIRTGWSPGDEP